jgi:hypothetical protein
MLIVIKVLVNGKDGGYLSKNRWDITKNKGEAKIYEIDDRDMYNIDKVSIYDVRRDATNFLTNHHKDESRKLDCKIIKWEISEIEIKE